MSVGYSIEDGELVVSNGETGAIRRHHFLDHCGATDVMPLTNGDAVVLFDYMCGEHRMRPFRNLLRVRSDGSVAWHAEARHPDASYVSVEWADGELWTSTWNGYRVRLDLETGRIREQEFAK